MKLPNLVTELCTTVHAAGGRAWLVGGVVRDHMMGIPPKDFDIEVHRIQAKDLLLLLARLGSVNEIGRSFGVFKLVRDGVECDVSIPRHDSQQGVGHRDIVVCGDPSMGIEAALRRRDLTINAMALDPLNCDIADPFGGAQDIERRQLAAVDPETFGHDPLRALRVIQFAARFGYTVQPELTHLCATMPLSALPPERVWGEVEKLLLLASKPSIGWDLLDHLGMTAKVLPELVSLPTAPIGAALDRAAQRRGEFDRTGRKLTLMLAAMLHSATPAQVEATLDRLNLHRSHGMAVRTKVIEITARWKHLAVAADDTTLRTLADETEVGLLAEVAAAVTGEPIAHQNRDRAMVLGVATSALPTLVKGRDLSALKVPPGPQMGEVLRCVRQAQLSGELTDRATALAWLKAHLQ